MPSKPTTWKTCQESLEEAQTEISRLTAERDDALMQGNALAIRGGHLEDERDALREDLRSVAEAANPFLNMRTDSRYFVERFTKATIELRAAIVRPGVQKALDTPADA